MADPFTIVGTTAAALQVAKVAWKLGNSLTKFWRDTGCVDDTVQKLADEVESLGNECDLVHTELEGVVDGSKQGSSSYDPNGRLGQCLATKIEESKRTIQELASVLDEIMDKASGFIGQAQRQIRLNRNREDLGRIRARIRTHTDGLRTTLLVINIKVAHLAPGNTNKELLEKLDTLQDMVNVLQRSVEGRSRASFSDDDTTLVQCAREVIKQGSTAYEASLPAASTVGGGQGAASRNAEVAKWLLEHSDNTSSMPSEYSADGRSRSMTEATSMQHDTTERNLEHHAPLIENDSDDDFAVDLAVATMETATNAFEASSWQEADSLLHETLAMVQQLPRAQRGFCDTFELQYRLAVCAFHSHEPADAEVALISLLQREPSSDEQRGLVYEATQLLSLLYVRMDDLERARSSCEKALQARRRLFGKNHDTSLASMALLVRIYQLLHNRNRAKVCLGMIPEARQIDVLHNIDAWLGVSPERFDMTSTLARSLSEDSKLESPADQLGLTRTDSAALSRNGEEVSPTASTWELLPRGNPDLPMRSAERAGGRMSADSRRLEIEQQLERSFRSTAGMEQLGQRSATGTSQSDIVQSGAEPSPSLEQNLTGLARSKMLSNLRLRPRGPLEEAICSGSGRGDLDKLIHQYARSKSWSSPGNIFNFRPSPLHYAALFGEVDIAKRIVSANKGLIDVTNKSLGERGEDSYTGGSPLHWAFLSRQAEVLDLFLTVHPSSLKKLADCPVNWAWWADRTVSDAERAHGSYIPDQVIATAEVLLKHGWSINKGMGTMGRTLLHFAALFGHKYDPNGTIALFLCEKGADPRKAKANAAYTIAVQESNDTLIRIFDSYADKNRKASEQNGASMRSMSSVTVTSQAS